MHSETILIGHLGRDPEIRHKGGDGDMFAVVSMATTYTWKNSAGEIQKTVEWHRVIFSNRLAEIVEEHLKKGSLIFVQGHNHTRKWQDESGNDRYSTEVIADILKMLDRPASKEDESASSEGIDATPQ